MGFHCFSPARDLQEFISCYAHYSIDSREVPEGIRCVPTGSPAIALNRGAPFAVYNEVFPEGILQDGNLFVGQQKRFYTMVPTGFFHHFCILFTPTGAYRLFGQAMGGLTCRAAPLGVLLPFLADHPNQRLTNGISRSPRGLSPGWERCLEAG